MISNSMVAHNFAHNVNESDKSGSMFWEKCRTYNTQTARFEETGERVIYSYGHHFAICKIDTNKDICLFTTRTYSNTTAKHISLVRWAISGLYDIIYVNDPDESAQSNAEHFADEIKQLFKKAVAARARKAEYLQLIESTYKTACRYLDVMGCKKSGTEYKTIKKAYNHTKTATGLKQVETLVKIDRERAKKAREATADVIKIGCHTFKREYLTMWANKVMNY